MDEHLVTMTDASTQKPAERGRGRTLVLLAVAIVVLAGLAAAYLLLSDARPGQSDVVEISAEAPVGVKESAVLKRLNSETEGEWRATRYSGKQLAKLEEHPGLALDVDAAARSRTVITNVEDDDSVARNGRLVVVGPSFRPAVERLLIDDPTVFADASIEGERRTYRLGGWIAYYSPEGADADRSDVVEQYLSEVAACPYDSGDCAGGDS